MSNEIAHVLLKIMQVCETQINGGLHPDDGEVLWLCHAMATREWQRLAGHPMSELPSEQALILSKMEADAAIAEARG